MRRFEEADRRQRTLLPECLDDFIVSCSIPARPSNREAISSFEFYVTSEGKIGYDQVHDAYLDGRGSDTLVSARSQRASQKPSRPAFQHFFVLVPGTRTPSPCASSVALMSSTRRCGECQLDRLVSH
jgi:hypothetical protein